MVVVMADRVGVVGTRVVIESEVPLALAGGVRNCFSLDWRVGFDLRHCLDFCCYKTADEESIRKQVCRARSERV